MKSRHWRIRRTALDISGLKNDDFMAWMPFMDAEVLVRYVDMRGLRAIQKAATKITFDRHQKTETLDAVEANRLLGRAAVRGWRGITMDGLEYPYGPDNCDFLMTRWTEFGRFVNSACLDLQGLMEEEYKAREKNSSATSGQGSITRP